MSSRPEETVAFALGGLAGNNAHGAGFLQAALDHGVRPQMISCTSGQILWVSRYLELTEPAAQAGAEETKSLRQQFEDDRASVQRTGNPDIDLGLLAMFGKEGVFRPLRPTEWYADWLHNAATVVGDVLAPRSRVMLAQAWLSLFPSRLLVPDFPNEFYEHIAKVFLESKIGIAFNSYNPREGKEYVYLNDAAREQLHQHSPTRRYGPGHPSPHHRDRTYREITETAVRDGLWLYQYGFERKASGFVDGAYFRGVMLAELTPANLIYAVRPLCRRWDAPLPTCYPEVEDLKTEVGFNGAYAAELGQIRLINKLLSDGAFPRQKACRYHHVEVEEIELEMQRGYFDYVMESSEVFERAHTEASTRFAHREKRSAERPASPAGAQFEQSSAS